MEIIITILLFLVFILVISNKIHHAKKEILDYMKNEKKNLERQKIKNIVDTYLIEER
jgi:hypothetical protein